MSVVVSMHHLPSSATTYKTKQTNLTISMRIHFSIIILQLMVFTLYEYEITGRKLGHLATLIHPTLPLLHPVIILGHT